MRQVLSAVMHINLVTTFTQDLQVVGVVVGAVAVLMMDEDSRFPTT